MRVMLVTEKPLQGEVSLTGPDGSAGDQARSVDQPDRGLAVVVLPQDVTLAIGVEVAGRGL